ncbi:hypothetical protein KIN34_06135 [Cellulomonas sp. DKR-3]|uniref:Uncharacterized protein n=1 Tax=Cellulomonas fulva TaxID=2835530 RepID=A0ABS5TXP2_9CELL|nr:hypothetical protein [Cellulomonas fulva]MBT0993864.1 hypothetical protein [Cellulomonas fulva]
MMTLEDRKAGFWWQVGRPCRAVGRGVRRVWSVLDFLEFLGLIARGVARMLRRMASLFDDWF